MMIKPEKRTIEVPRTVDGKEFRMPQEITVRVPESRQVRRQVPVFEDGNYSEVFAFAPPPEVQVEDPNIKSQIEEMQAVPWTPPRTIRINFATTRNIVNPNARDATRFGRRDGRADLRLGARGHLGFENARRAAAVAGTRATDAARQLQSQPDFDSDRGRRSSRRSATRCGRRRAVDRRRKTTSSVFVHGYNNSFRFSCVRFAQLVYDTRFEGKPILFSWPANGGDSLLDELTGIVSYGSDLKDAKASVDSLAKVLREVAVDKRKPSNAATKRGDIHLVAHSMGCAAAWSMRWNKLRKEWEAGRAAVQIDHLGGAGC